MKYKVDQPYRICNHSKRPLGEDDEKKKKNENK